MSNLECGDPWGRGRPARMLTLLDSFEVMRAGRPRPQGSPHSKLLE
jgi:hypothetical protein